MGLRLKQVPLVAILIFVAFFTGQLYDQVFSENVDLQPSKGFCTEVQQVITGELITTFADVEYSNMPNGGSFHNSDSSLAIWTDMRSDLVEGEKYTVELRYFSWGVSCSKGNPQFFYLGKINQVSPTVK